MIKRFLGLYLRYLIIKIYFRKRVKFNGFTIVYNFTKSSISFIQGVTKTTINSSPFSNMVGLYQRTIIVARYGGKITIGSGCGISGSTIYAMEEINIGNNVLIGGNCKIIDNDFHPLPASLRINQKSENIRKKTYKHRGRLFYWCKLYNTEGHDTWKKLRCWSRKCCIWNIP